MSGRIIRYAVPVCGAFIAVAFAAGPSLFQPRETFKAASLQGWHTLGDADWKVENGEIVGTPKSPEGGWLIFDKSYQDVGFYASVKCATGCRSGVLLRAETKPEGMSGTFVSFNDTEQASFNLKLDAQGKETDRTKLRAAGGQTRFAPAADAAGGRGGRGGAGRAGGGAARGGAPAYGGPGQGPVGWQVGAWNNIEIVLDTDILRPKLNGGNTLAGGATEDQMAGYGPIALYAGGAGEVRFKDVEWRDLNPKSEPKELVSKNFRLQRINDMDYAWGVAVADINHDGIPDIISGPFYYLGPDYTQRHEYMRAQTYNVSNQYAPNMITFAYDFTGDGWPDIIATENRPLVMYVNPQGESRRWTRYPILPGVSTEIALMKDLFGDGKPAILFGGGGQISWARPDPADPTKPWTVHAISDKINLNPHGLGVGDINKDGRLDVIGASGWWEQPDKANLDEPWPFHPEYFGTGGAEMAVYDVNGDGLPDVVSSIEAHGWGLSWFEQKKDRSGQISFVEHKVMDNFTTKNAGNVTFSQLHGAIASDLDGDGIPEFITGKRMFSHQESWEDPDPYGAAVLYSYKAVRNPKAEGGAELVPELIHNRSGVGSQIAAADLNNDGAIDIVTSTDRGTFIFWGTPRGKTKTTAAAH